MLANTGTTVNLQTCTLGSSCTVPAAAGTLTGYTGTSGNIVTSTGTLAGIQDSGTALTNLAVKGSPTFTGTVTMPLTTAGLVTTTSGGVISSEASATVGQGGLGTTTAPSSAQIPIAQSASAYAPETVSGDCTMASSGAITCTKTSGVAFGSGATATIANYALLASPTFSGTPAAPTATSGTSTTQIATTAYVQGTTLPAGNLTGTVPNSTIGNNNVRTICYVAGSDNGATLDTTYSQRSYFSNMIGAMIVTNYRCQVDAGSVTATVNKTASGGSTQTAIFSGITCSANPTTSPYWNTGTASVALGLNDSLDLSITAASTSKRLTMCVTGTVN